MNYTYQYIDISKRNHGLDDANETIDIEIVAACIMDADQEYLRTKGVHPSKNAHIVVRCHTSSRSS